jgi:hypothetical protein
MGSYAGVATMERPDGTNRDVRVRLDWWLEEPSGLWAWDGTADDVADWLQLGDEITVRLPDGRSGRMLVRSINIGTSGERTELLGTGAPPGIG